MHLGHARGAAWGDSVARLMQASGYAVTREYYVNDAGNQIVNLGKSLQARYREHLGLPFELPADGYHGEDVREIAIALAEENGDRYAQESEENLKFFKQQGIAFELAKIRKDLDYY
ncbi:MAG: arginine--tRNA ligase, partial [Merdibacter sp.]